MIEPRFLTRTQRTELEQIVRRPSEDHGVARRANAILLLDDGKSCTVIAEFLYPDDDTVRNWREFRDKVTDNFRVISHQNFRVIE